MAVAPPNLVWLGNHLKGKIPTYRFSGIVGDAAHAYGFHMARNQVSSSDYSRQGPWNDGGSSNYSSAIDLSFGPAQMKIVTARLRKAALDPDDVAMEIVREYFGTENGYTVTGKAHTSPTGAWSNTSSDDSHLWHVHISIFRDFCNDRARMEKLADVLIGKESGVSAEDVVKGLAKDGQLDTKAMEYDAEYVKGNPSWAFKTGMEIAVRDGRRNAAKIGAIEEKLDLLLKAQGADPADVEAAAARGAEKALSALKITMSSTK